MRNVIGKNGRFALIGTVILATISLAGCSLTDSPAPSDTPMAGQQGSLTESNTVCGYDDVLPSPARFAYDPCQSGDVVLSQTLGGRGIGHHGRGSATSFNLDAKSRVCINVDHHSRFDLPILVDGKIVRPHRLTNGDKEYKLELDAGSHRLRVAGAWLSGAQVEVRSSRVRLGQARVMGENGILELTNVATDHTMFSPNGDGFHDGTYFVADNYPWALPGELSGQFQFHLDWQWEVINADTCESLGVVASGQTAVHSPAHVRADWDGSAPTTANAATALGSSVGTSTPVADGRYLYIYRADLMRSDGLWIDSVESHPHGMIIDATSSPDPNALGTMAFNATAMTNPNDITTCDPNTDPYGCNCPTSGLPSDERCTWAMTNQLVRFDDPTTVPTGDFITTTYDSNTGRYKVTVDLRTFNGGGLIPQTNGTFSSIDQLQNYIAELTGVPPDPNHQRLFNFDYVQLGYSTPVFDGQAITGFNHFLLDVITDPNGRITIGGTTYDLPTIFGSPDSYVPPLYRINNDRDGDECYINGNTNGSTSVKARSCTQVRVADLDPGRTDLGIYRIRTRMYELKVNGEGTVRQNFCVSKGCGVRTYQRDGKFGSNRDQYIETSRSVDLARQTSTSNGATPALIIETDRYFDQTGHNEPIDGVCMHGSVISHNMEVPLAGADGAVPSSCIIDGIAI